MKIKEIPWEIEPHTQAKLEILRKYLQAWFPILSSTHGRIIYIDGFAGPGEYIYRRKPIDGSPIVAIETFLHHQLREKIKEIVFVFIEKDKDIFNFLEKKLQPYKKQGLKIHTEHNEFDIIANDIFDKLEKEGSKIAPTFCFIDPFGIKGLPLTTIKRFMDNKSCEVLINFMYEDLNRFIELPQNENNVKELFGGTQEWQNVTKINAPQERYFFLTSLYEKQLKDICDICYIRTFDMINKFNKQDYVLFFCTKHKLGLEKMKEAMWKIDDSGNFTFSDATYNPRQMVLFEKEPDYQRLKRMILKEYKGKKVYIEELEDFVLLETPFLPRSHLKTPILRPMEKNDEIKIHSPRKKRMSYPKNTIIEFL